MTREKQEGSRAAAVPAPPRAAGGADLALALLLSAGAFAIVLAGTASEMFQLDRFSVPKELALNATALLAAPLLAAGWRKLRPSAPDALLGAFVAWSALSAALATNRWIALRAFAITLSGFLVFLAARRISRGAAASPFDAAREGSRNRTIALRAIALAAVAGAATGVLQAYGLELTALAEERAPGGTFGNRNFLAHLTAICVPVVALAAANAERREIRWFWLAALAVCGNAIVLTRSRAGWLGLTAAGLTAAIAILIARRIFSLTDGRRRLASIGLALAAGAAAALLLPNTLDWRSDSPYAETLTRLTDYRAGSGRGRLVQYRNSLKLVPLDPVFGTGPGNWFVEYPLVTSDGDPSYAGADPIPTNPWPSSDWVALLAERAPVGLVLGLLAGAAIVAAALRRLRRPDPPAALDAVALLALIAAAAVTGLFDAVMLNAAPAFFIAAATGLLLPASRAIVDRPLPARSRTILIALVLAATLAATVRSAQQLAAIRIVERGEASRQAIERALAADPPNHRLHLRLSTRGDCAARLSHARAAARLMPFHEAPRRAIAACD